MPYIISTPTPDNVSNPSQSYYNSKFLVWPDGTVNFPPYTLNGSVVKAGNNGDLIISGSVSTNYLYAAAGAALELFGVVFKSATVASLDVMADGANLVYGNSSVDNTVWLTSNTAMGDYVYFINNQLGAARVTITVACQGSDKILNNLNTLSSTVVCSNGLFYWKGDYWLLLTN